MRNRLVTFSLLAAALLSSTLASAQAARRTAAADPDMTELAAYTLTVDALNRVDRINRAVLANMQKDPKYAERIALEKELAALKKKQDTTEAEDKRIETIEARIEKMDASADAKDDEANTLADIERKINGMPPMAAALKQEGLSARDYAKFTLAMVQAGFAAAAQQMTAKMGKPFQPPAGINPANITFVQEHAAEIKKMEESYGQLTAIK